MQVHNIPADLRERPQWVCCGADKIPINPKTKRYATVTDSSTWGTFEEAVAAGYAHIGYVLHSSDPFTIIDLDNKVENPAPPEELARHAAMIEHFASYTERSASGRGTHIIVRGQVPKGARRGHTEVYSDARYMICTGDVVRDLPIVERQGMLDAMYSQMAPAKHFELDADGVEEFSDREIHERALNAENGEKYDLLTRNDQDWQPHYESQSEADLALISLLTFYSKSNAQVKRLFRLGPLGRREKAQREDYLDLTIARARGSRPTTIAPIDEAVIDRLLRKEASREEAAPLTFPDGLVGDIARYIVRAATRPVDEIAIAAGLAFVSGVAGGAYDTDTKSGVNLYQIVLAKTGCGKEAAQQGIERLMTEVAKTVPSANAFLGPSHFASGQAILKALDVNPAFLSVLGEIGITLQSWCDPSANSAERLILKVLLDSYGKSGAGNTIRPLAYSDAKNNTRPIASPSLSILGEGVPSKFYESLDSSHVDSGLLARFLIVEYFGDRPEENEAPDVQPSPALIEQTARLAGKVLQMQSTRLRQSVPLAEPARNHLKSFSRECDDIIRSSDDITAQLWNRAHLNALRVATTLAVGCDSEKPIVNLEQAKWACDFVARSIKCLLDRFAEGLSTRSRAHALIESVVDAYLKMPVEKRMKSGATKRCAELGIIPFRVFFMRLSKHHVFANDRRGERFSIDEALKTFVDCGRLELLDAKEVRDIGGRGAKHYRVTLEW